MDDNSSDEVELLLANTHIYPRTHTHTHTHAHTHTHTQASLEAGEKYCCLLLHVEDHRSLPNTGLLRDPHYLIMV